LIQPILWEAERDVPVRLSPLLNRNEREAAWLAGRPSLIEINVCFGAKSGHFSDVPEYLPVSFGGHSD
jgi:hypothetical protein